MNMTLSSAANTSGAETRERILDAAEALFIENGFAATSLRAIATRAEVNLAATNYHFGSKLGLLGATVHRRMQPINERRLYLLKALKESDRSLTTRSILEVFFEPIRELDQPQIPSLMGRIFGEPQSLIRPMMQEEFSEVASTFQNALLSVLPGVKPEEMGLRFHFMIGSMIHLLQTHVPLGSESNETLFTESIDRLIDYSVAGLEQHQQESKDD